jgi:general secretion pathway protein F
MLAAGQDLDATLRFAAEQTPGRRTRNLLATIHQRVRGGAALASALGDHPASFSRLYVGMVQAGEAGGDLAGTLGQLAELLDRDQRLAAAVHAALLYPALLLAAAASVIALLLAYVLPEFKPIFDQAGVQLPPATRGLIALGDAARQGLPWLTAGGMAALVSARRLLQAPGIRLGVDGWLLKLPMVGEIVRQTQASHLSRTLGALLQNGVGLLSALTIAREVVSNLAMRRAVEQIERAVKHGAGLSRPFAAAGLFPARTAHFLRLGEETGRLGEMALRAAESHDQFVQLTLQRLLSLLVPAITVITGLIVAGIIASLVTAMLRLNELAF